MRKFDFENVLFFGAALVEVVWIVGIIYVAWHFISKYW